MYVEELIEDFGKNADFLIAIIHQLTIQYTINFMINLLQHLLN
jgi:hypothetical protein